jgi:transcriptional regulator with XRE-family HTH domain
MTISDEREAFSLRLKEALKAAGDRADSPTALARAFNRRFPGQPVSVHAARKWLYGEAIPGQEKLRVLAEWLGRSTEWLRYGGIAPTERPREIASMNLDYELMRAISALNAPHQRVVRDLVRSLGRAERCE